MATDHAGVILVLFKIQFLHYLCMDIALEVRRRRQVLDDAPPQLLDERVARERAACGRARGQARATWHAPALGAAAADEQSMQEGARVS